MANMDARLTLTIAGKAAGKNDYRRAAAFIGAVTLVAGVALGLIDRSAAPTTAYLPLGAIGIGLVLLVMGHFFAAHFVLNRDPAMLVGLAVFLVTALILTTQALVQVGYLGSMPVALQWLVVARHIVFVIGLVLYALVRRSGFEASRQGPATRPLFATAVIAILIAAGVVGAVLGRADRLPALILGDGRSLFATHVLAPGLLLFHVVAALIMVTGRRRPSVLDLWLATAGVAGVALYCETAFIIGVDGSARLILQAVQIEVFAMLVAVAVIIGLEVVALHNRSLALNDELRRLAPVDDLTGLANDAALEARLRLECGCVDREGSRLALLMIDIDHLEAFNASHGRLAGDHCIQAIAGALRAIVRRPSDLVARRGGGTFAIVLSGASAAEAREVATRIVAAVSGLGVPHADRALGVVTVSIGLAAYRPGDGEAALVLHAEAALARAKAGGRGRVLGGEEDSVGLDGEPALAPLRTARS